MLIISLEDQSKIYKTIISSPFESGSFWTQEMCLVMSGPSLAEVFEDSAKKNIHSMGLPYSHTLGWYGVECLGYIQLPSMRPGAGRCCFHVSFSHRC